MLLLPEMNLTDATKGFLTRDAVEVDGAEERNNSSGSI
jgi:hypothetical protein